MTTLGLLHLIISIYFLSESSTGALISTERAARKGGELPEDIGKETALQLLEEVWRGGVVDSVHQPLVLLLMVLGPEDVSKVRVICISYTYLGLGYTLVVINHIHLPIFIGPVFTLCPYL